MSGPMSKFVWTLVVVTCAAIPLAVGIRAHRRRQALAPEPTRQQAR